MGVVIPKDILPALVPRVIGVSDSPGLLSSSYGSDLEVLEDIDDYAFMTKDIPGKLTAFRGWPDERESVMHYKRVIFYDSQHGV